ncbi:FAD-dependent oxidoreductase [Roseateles toxinivorans]|uniref:D-amino-acid dehydrogenase n=1 Tax=Roseateles toxinivorans TaxID=270368 RepID=A0A4R6QTL7_9BURK|nr:FAD-dependent oxidoreductase [Roseateles toxinivorans]TDP74209.1 D-amino-acid dehydrogenase [Roseateles toxinivorans]
MKVAVIGAGIIGVTTAYELAADGHQVTVFERSGSVAAGTSFANAGIVAPGYVSPWAAPGMPAKVLRGLFSTHTPVRLHATMDMGTVRWLWKAWRASRLKAYQANRAAMHGLASYSRDRLHELVRTLKLDYERADGYLVLLRGERELAGIQPGLQLLTELGQKHRLLDAAECRQVEPGLSADTELRAGVHLPQDEVGNCRQFAHLMKNEAQRLGVQFRFHTTVQHLSPGAKPQLMHQYTPPGESLGGAQDAANSELASVAGPATQPMVMGPVLEDFDAILVCAAMGAPALLHPHGLKLPMAAVYGYSITAPLRHIEAHPDLGPRAGLMDERYKVAISRLGHRVRVAGSAEFGGAPGTMNKGAIATLYKVLHDWFPGAAQSGKLQHWKGARPMLPDGPPVLGACGIPGVWLNLGHGSSGWALSCGSARVLADQVAGRAPEVKTEGLGVERLR